MTQSKKLKSKKTTFFISGKWYMFSNFAAFKVVWRGVMWETSEHAYQAAKFFDDGAVRYIARQKVQNARSAHMSKKVAHQNDSLVRGDWKQVNLEIMEEIVRAKLRQHLYIQRKLLETGSTEIVEDSPFDSFWGRGPDWKGENHLGKIWMKLREELRERGKM